MNTQVLLGLLVVTASTAFICLGWLMGLTYCSW